MTQPAHVKQAVIGILLDHPHNEISREAIKKTLPPGYKKANGRNNIGEAYRITLRQLDRAGAIKRDGDLIIILDRDELRTQAESPRAWGGVARAQ